MLNAFDAKKFRRKLPFPFYTFDAKGVQCQIPSMQICFNVNYHLRCMTSMLFTIDVI